MHLFLSQAKRFCLWSGKDSERIFQQDRLSENKTVSVFVKEFFMFRIPEDIAIPFGATTGTPPCDKSALC
jgi:hypothetical protein